MATKLVVSAEAQRKGGEIIQELAKATGVNPKDVEKIMNHLNLEGSLAHREYKTEQVQRFQIGVPTRRLSDVTLQSVRIATSDVAL